MPEFYSAESRALQDRFDTRRIADALVENTVEDTFNADAREFIANADMFFLATVDADGQPDVSYKGGDPGFVRIVDERTLAWPNYDGNGMYRSMGNIAAARSARSTASRVALLFVNFIEPDRLRVHGEASLHFDDPLLGEFPEAQFIVRLRATRVFPNCPRYVHTMSLVKRSKFVPRRATRTPVPEWKKMDWALPHLRKGDPASEPGRKGEAP
ncbi:MAG: pyridoxamine 5'-phosphate oxidase family protein [Thermoplasmatota archaeon]